MDQEWAYFALSEVYESFTYKELVTVLPRCFTDLRDFMSNLKPDERKAWKHQLAILSNFKSDSTAVHTESASIVRKRVFLWEIVANLLISIRLHGLCRNLHVQGLKERGKELEYDWYSLIKLCPDLVDVNDAYEIVVAEAIVEEFGILTNVSWYCDATKAPVNALNSYVELEGTAH